MDTQQTGSAISNFIQSILHLRFSGLLSAQDDLTTVRIIGVSFILEVFDSTTINGSKLHLSVNYLLVYVCYGLIQDLNKSYCLSEKKG